MENTTSSLQPSYLPLSVTKSRGWNSSAARANGGQLNCRLLFSLPLIYSNSPTYTSLFLTLYHHQIHTSCSLPLFSNNSSNIIHISSSYSLPDIIFRNWRSYFWCFITLTSSLDNLWSSSTSKIINCAPLVYIQLPYLSVLLQTNWSCFSF